MGDGTRLMSIPSIMLLRAVVELMVLPLIKHELDPARVMARTLSNP